MANQNRFNNARPITTLLIEVSKQLEEIFADSANVEEAESMRVILNGYVDTFYKERVKALEVDE